MTDFNCQLQYHSITVYYSLKSIKKISWCYKITSLLLAQNITANLTEYITLHLDSTNEVEQWYVRHNYFIVLLHRRHVSTYIQVIFRPSFTDKSIAFYGLICKRGPEDDLYIGRNMLPM